MHHDLTSSALRAIEDAFGVKDAAVEWQATQDAAHGDLTTITALRLAKTVGKSPKEIAEVVAKALQKDGVVQKAEVAGAGYVNVWLKPADLLGGLDEVGAACEAAPERKGERPVIVEYCSLNIAKPLGVHHILTTMIGQVLANLYAHAGCPVVRWNYLGDWGTQFGKLYVAYERWAEESDPEKLTLDALLALYVRFHEEAEKDPALDAEGQAAFKRLEQGDPEVRRVWQAFVDVTKRAVAPVLQRLTVRFDTEVGESHYEQAMAPIIEEGKKKGVFKTGEKGALIVEFPEESKLPPAVVLKSDGATNYLTRDLALVLDRVARYEPAAILHVVGVEQSLHFKQLMATAGQMQWKLPPWEHLSFGRMHFADKGMSTRKGNILRLEHVLQEAVDRARAVIAERGESIQTDDPEALAEMMGVGAVVYGVLSQNRKMDITFDWDRMLSFEGNSAPYLQYTHARAKSVLRKAEGDAGEFEGDPTEHDRRLIRILLQFPAVLNEARAEHLPHKLTNYLFALCQEFNAFYNAEPILKAEGSARSLRLALTDLTASVLRAGATILCLRLPDRM
jgi:arginyl-tRNA synthetase